MKADAALKLADRLVKIRSAVAALRSAENADGMDAAWLEFIRSASRFYSTLEQASKVHGKAKAWFGRQKHVRKNDELLSYIHHARDVEEHGLRHITSRDSSKVVLRPGGEVWFRSDGKRWHVDAASGDVRPSYDIVSLVAVRDDRYNDTFEPPTSHKGNKLTVGSPLEVAELALVHFEVLFREAKTLVFGSS